MSTSGAEALALNGVLVAMAEIEHALALQTTGDLSHEAALLRIREHVESPLWIEHVQLAKALIAEAPTATAAPPAADIRTFFGIVTEFDTQRRDKADPPRGPLLFECYLNEFSADRSLAEEKIASRAFSMYGWNAVATITVEFPKPVFAVVPAALAAVHD